MNHIEMLEDGWIERKDFWLKKGKYGTCIISKNKK